MLQPLQLKDVSVQYAAEIAELRGFFGKAGSPIGTNGSLGYIAARLADDRPFRRDLMSHLWVVICGRDREISYSDLLGLLAVAAAGTSFAALANEDDAHDLLRFLMEVRRSLYQVPQQRNGTQVPWAAEPEIAFSAEPSAWTDTGQEISDGPVQTPRTEFSSAELLQSRRYERGRLVSVTAAACLLAALSVVAWRYHRPAAEDRSTQRSSAPIAAQTLVPRPAAFRGREEASTTPVRSPAVGRVARGMASKRTAQVLHEVQRSAPFTSAPSGAFPSQATTTARRGPVSQPVVAVQLPMRPAASPFASPPTGTAKASATGAAVGVSAGSSGWSSGTSPVAKNPPGQGSTSANERTIFSRPLRRRSSLQSAAEEEVSRLGDVGPGGDPAVLENGRIGAESARSRGIVRLTSLGTMAANVLYSPVPAYPAAASAERVQGEVKVRADVDRHGNVAAVRVVSGPPQLRDAALDAVQRWHYRPYLSYGKPAPMTAIAIVDFQLP